MRDPSLLVYFRGESGGLVMGGYERHPAPWSLDGIPADFNGRLLDEDWPRFEELMTNALVRVPALEEMEVIRLINGPEAFTPDGEFILGPTDVRGFWVAAGFCAHGLGAACGEKAGWERANWFEPNAARGDESLRPRGWAGRLWSPAIDAEHVACRETAAIFDETSFAKIEIAGEGAAEFLEQLCDNRVARDVGAITYTQMLNPRGGIECDFTVTRIAEDRFRIVTGTAFGQHDGAWIRSHAPEDGSVSVEDVTSKYACLGLWGSR